MLVIAPEQLTDTVLSLPTGTLLLCSRKFKFLQVGSWAPAFMGWVLRPKNWKYPELNIYHGAILRWDAGLPFVIESTFFQRSRPKTLANWIASRKGDEIVVKVNHVADEKIVCLLDIPYDLPAATSLVWQKVTGRWNGHTGSHAVYKNWCLELLARALGLDNSHAASLEDFGI